MIKIDYLIDGKAVNPETLTDITKRKAIQVAKNFVIERIQDIRDPETGLFPQITIVDESKDGLSFHVEGPESLRARIKNALEA